MAGRAQPPGLDRVAQVAQLGLGAAGRLDDSRPEPLGAERGVGLGLRPAELVVHVQRVDAVAERPERMPEAGRVGAAGDETEDVASRRDEVVRTHVLLDAPAESGRVHTAILETVAREEGRRRSRAS